MNPNNDNSNPTAAMKTITDATNEANEWSAFVPFLLRDCPNKINFVLISMFSMAHLQPCEKELCFKQKHKPSDKSSWKTLLRD